MGQNEELAVVAAVDDPLADYYPLTPEGQVIMANPSGFGLADLWFHTTRNAASAFRYSTALMALPVTGGDVVIPAGTTTSLFVKGMDDGSGSQGFPGALTVVETDAFGSGAMVKDGQSYVIRYVAVQPLRPFILNGSVKVYPTWLDTYAPRIFAAIAENLAARLTFDDSECKYDLGPIWQLAPHSTLQGTAIPNQGVGAGIGPAQLMPLRRPVITGARDKVDKMKILIQGGYALTIESDPLLPIPDDITLIQYPILVNAYGYPRPAPCNPCNFPMLDVVQMMTRMPPELRASNLAAIKKQYFGS